MAKRHHWRSVRYVLLGDSGEAVADKPVIGLDLDKTGGQRRATIESQDVDRKRNIQRRGADAGNFRGAIPVCIGER
jgi:hypothetical protein